MKLSSPILEAETEASNKLIADTVTRLKKEVGEFLILSQDEMNYVQALMTERGYVVRFQEGSIDRHFEFETLLSRPKVIALFQNYLARSPKWQGEEPFSSVNLRGFWGSLGLILGRFFGSFVRGMKDARKET